MDVSHVGLAVMVSVPGSGPSVFRTVGCGGPRTEDIHAHLALGHTVRQPGDSPERHSCHLPQLEVIFVLAH